MARYIKPTLNTKFHIDFGWWQEQKQSLRYFLNSHTCDDCREALADYTEETFDWINPMTGQVFQIDKLWHIIYTHCQDDPDYIDERMPLTTAVFRMFIANNNTPLTAIEIHDRLPKKSAAMILKTIGGRKTYRGIKPVSFG